MHMLAMDSGQTFANWLPPLLMIAGVVVLGVIAALMIRNGKPDQIVPPSPPPQHPPFDALQRAELARQQIQDVQSRVGELIGAAQRLSVKLDDKMAKFEQLLARQDRQAKPAAPAHQTTSSSGVAKPPLPKPPPLVAKAPAVTIEPKHVANKPAKSTGNRSPKRQAEHEFDPVKSAIYKLADTGRPPVDIARELNEHPGKVELILALRNM